MRALWVICLLVSVRSGGAAVSAGAARAALAAGGVFSLQSTVLLNSAERRDREIGYRLEAELAVAPAPDPGPADDGDKLLCFTLYETRLLVRGVKEWTQRRSVWDQQRGAGSGWCARLRAGAVAGLLLSPGDPPDVRDYKRALASLFHFQGSMGEEPREETDSLGSCSVSYEAVGEHAARRVRRACAGDEAGGAAARRALRLELAGGALAALHAEEVLALHGALKARSWHALQRARAAHPAAPPPGLAPHALPLEAVARARDEDGDEDAGADLEDAIRTHSAALEGEEAGAGGGAAAARALCSLLPALRRASQPALAAALERAERRALPALCRALGLAGTAAAARAAAAFTRLPAADPLDPLARAFLAGFALAPAADREAALEVLRLAGEARRPALAAAALQAAAAAARGDQARAAVREALARGLARCRDAECRAARLLALGNLRTDAPETLVESAERDAPRAAAAALAALHAAPDLSATHLARLGRLATNESLPLELRAAALELVVTRRAAGARAAAPLQLAELARALHAERSAAAHELRRVLWQRLDAERSAPPVRALLPLLPDTLRTWDARAHAGTSHVLRRDTGWGGGAGGWRALLESVQVAAGGLLRRGAVALQLRPPAGPARAPDLQVEVWTRGLDALAGEPAAPAGEPEPPAAGLALAVGGKHLRDVTLFDGQAELLGHVWAGTGSTPTPVLRALRPEPEALGVLPLLGGCALRVRARAASALALDAHAAASLWHRTARGALELRAALAAEAAADVRVSWAELRARRDLTVEPRLRISLALDFYDGVALCVRAAVPEHAVEDALRLRAVLPDARRLNVSRGATARRVVPGRTLALGRANDAACRDLRAADDDDE